MDNRKYPIGPFASQDSYSDDQMAHIIDVIEASPLAYRQVVEGLSNRELAKTYREGSWTVQQLIHHVSDISFLHFLRMKQALTNPDYGVATMINMDGWANTPDGINAPISDSLNLFEGVHRRYAYLAKSLTPAMLAVSYYHPTRQLHFNQAQALAISAWHVQHHLAHIKLALA
ncbi:bacillithiol transferase BstA [Spirosoma horti]